MRTVSRFMKERAVRTVLTLLLLVTTATAWAQTSASYRAYNTSSHEFETLTANSCTEVTTATTTMGAADTETWYVVSSNITMNSSRIEVLGTVNLILADGYSLRAEKGFHVASGTTLNIYGQSGDTGQLHSFATTDGQAGIGGNYDEADGTIAIHGGNIEAIGCNWGAGIGGGRNGNGGTITIYGGSVNATGGATGAGIGGGAGKNCGTVTIIGGTVIAQATTSYDGDNSQAIGSGAGTGITGGTLNIYGIRVYSSANAENPVAPANKLSTCQSKYVKLMPCTEHNFVNGVCTLCGAYPPLTYVAYETATHTFSEHTYEGSSMVVETSTTTMGTADTETWYAVRNNITVGSRIEVRGTVHLILCDGKTLTASKGIAVNTGNSLTIYGQSDGTGALNANATDAGDNHAGIGSNRSNNVGDITIHGGRITAEGAAWSAGIGGGMYGGGGSVTIYGGTINARGHDTGSEAIGHGSSGSTVARTIAAGLRVYVGGTLQTYGYLSWSLSQNGSTVTLTPCTEHHTTTAHCDYCNIACGSITYNGNNATSGTVPASSATYLAGETVTVLDNTGSLVRTGYTFDGWNTQADGLGTDYAPSTTITISGSVTLYAKWTPITYTVRFHKNDGGADVYTDQAFTYNVAQTLTANAFTRDGYQYLGWSTTTNGAVAYTDGQSVNNLANVQDAVVNLYAKWTEIYSITYDLAGGTADNPTTYTAQSATITLTNPTRDGYVFAGWTGTGLAEPTMTVTIAHGSTGNRTYTATWAEIYTITYDLADGSASNPTTYTALSDDITLNNPTRDGYEFAGWTGTGLDEPTMTVTIAHGSTGNRSYTATWNAITGIYLAYNTTTGEFETRTVPDDVISVTSSTTIMGSNDTETWYIVDSDVTVSDRITVNGTVNLILGDGQKLTALKGIYVRHTTTKLATLNIYGQSGGTGKLFAYSYSSNYAGIGGNNTTTTNNCGNITIHGGTITAMCARYTESANPSIEYFACGAGIGGSYRGNGGTITIHGGTVDAYGGKGAAGIGGGATDNMQFAAGDGGTITITGGTVNAIGGNSYHGLAVSGGAGIGGGGFFATQTSTSVFEGNGGAGGTITITGGTVTATAPKGAAGIGGGNRTGGNGGTITITGGTVIATAGAQAVTSGTTRAQAIGRGEFASDEGTLILGDMKVYTSAEATTPVASGNRESTCRGTYAKLMPCTEHNYSDNVCNYCGAVMLTLANNDDNSTAISAADGEKHDVSLAGRTLYKDGDWNTLCLPFDVDDFTDTPLQGATVKTLESTEFSNGELTMNFSNDVTSIEAGKPYIVKWSAGSNIENPVFSNVTISDTNATVETDYMDFIGTYSPVIIYEEGEEKHNLYLGSSNNIYYPTRVGYTIKACRGYFQLKNGLTVANITTARMNFDDEATSIVEMRNREGEMRNGSAWYTLDGRKLNGKPTTKGLYIHNGRKVVIKNNNWE